MWVVGLLELGLTDEEFWSLTPRMYDKLLRHKIELDKEQDYRASLTPWILTSLYREKDSPAPKLGNFLGKYFPRWKKREKPQKTEDQIQAARLADAVMNRDKNGRSR